MDSSAVSDEEVDDQRETSQDQLRPNKSLSKISGKEKEDGSFCSADTRTAELSPPCSALFLQLWVKSLRENGQRRQLRGWIFKHRSKKRS